MENSNSISSSGTDSNVTGVVDPAVSNSVASQIVSSSSGCNSETQGTESSVSTEPEASGSSSPSNTPNSSSVTSSTTSSPGLLSSSTSLGVNLLSSASLASMGSAMPSLTALNTSVSGSPTLSSLNLGSNTIAKLFDLGEGLGGDSVKVLMEKYPYLPIFVISALVIAQSEEVTTEMFVQSIQSQQKRMKASTTETINRMQARQEKSEEVSKDSWEARVGIDRTGLARRDDESGGCAKVILALALIFICWIFPQAILGVVALFIIVSIVSTVIDAAVTDPAKKRNINKILSYFNFVDVFVDAFVAVTCEIFNCKETDETMQKMKMWMKVISQILIAIIMIVVSIAVSVVTGGGAALPAFAATALKILQIVSTIISAAAAIAKGVTSIAKGIKDLDVAKKRLILNRLVAFLEKSKLDLETLKQDLDLLIELFSSNMSNVRAEYDKASRILKEYNDTKLAISRNLKA